MQNFVFHSNINSNEINRMFFARNDNPRAIRLCSNLPYYKRTSANIATPGDYKSGYTAYTY